MNQNEIKEIIKAYGIDTNVQDDWKIWIDIFKLGLGTKKSKLESIKDFESFQREIIKDIKSASSWSEIKGICNMSERIITMTGD